MMRSEKTVAAAGNGGRRSVSAILARRQARKARRRQVFPPDFVHGEVELAAIYDELGADWVERALFVVDEGDVTTVAYFDDYFLVVDQWQAGGTKDWHCWWEKHRRKRDRLVILELGQGRRVENTEVAVKIAVDRDRLGELEQGLLGLVRDGVIGGRTAEDRLRQGQVDILSLVTMTGALAAR